MKVSVAILALVCVCVAAAINVGEIKHTELDGAHLIETSFNNYAITNRPALNQNLWKSVSVNGNNVVIFTPTCQVTTKDLSALSEGERTLISTAKLDIETVNNNIGGGFVNSHSQTSISSYSIGGGQVQSNSGQNINYSSFQNGELSIHKQDDNNFSITKPGLPNDIARVFVNNDVVTYVYRDGHVQMKPLACLSQDEQQALQVLRNEVTQAEQQFKESMSMMQNQMQHSMNNMQQQMQQSMQNMHNMFGNGFGNFFNNGAGANTFAQTQQMRPYHNNHFINGNYLQQPAFHQQQSTATEWQPTQGAYANSFAAPANGHGSYQYASPNYMHNNQLQSYGAGAGSHIAPLQQQQFGMQMNPQSMFGSDWPFGPNNNPFQGGFFSN